MGGDGDLGYFGPEERELAGPSGGHGAVRRRPRGVDAGRAPAGDRGGPRDGVLRAEPVEAVAAHADPHVHHHVRFQGRSAHRRRSHQRRARTDQGCRRDHGQAVRRARSAPAALGARVPGGLCAVVRGAHSREAGRRRTSAVPRGADAGRRARRRSRARSIPPTVPELRAYMRRRDRPRRLAGDRVGAQGRRALLSPACRGRVATGAEGRLAARVRDAATAAPRGVRDPARSSKRAAMHATFAATRLARPLLPPKVRYIAPYQEWRLRQKGIEPSHDVEEARKRAGIRLVP